MYSIQRTNKFKKDWKRCEKRGLPMDKIKGVIRILADTGTLPEQYRLHKLTGKYAGCLECHILADWLLVWQQDDTELVLLLTDTGSHSDLF